MNDQHLEGRFSRREFIRTTAASAAAIPFLPFVSESGGNAKPDSRFGGVQIGAITYSWRSMPGKAEDILDYCIRSGISSVELMGNVAEEYAGIPPQVTKPRNFETLGENERKQISEAVSRSGEERRKWRLSGAKDKYRKLKKMFDKAGVKILIVKFSPGRWSDEEIDYAFESARILGAGGVTDEIGEETAKRLGKFAEKHGMLAIYHNHAQPGQPGFSFEHFLDYSPANMLNFDAGHYFGVTGKHPNEIIERLHERIFSIHLKDKTGPAGNPPNTNKSWGEGETPLADILRLVQNNKWNIPCDIELEYPIPEGSDAVRETTRCVSYCRDILGK